GAKRLRCIANDVKCAIARDNRRIAAGADVVTPNQCPVRSAEGVQVAMRAWRYARDTCILRKVDKAVGGQGKRVPSQRVARIELPLIVSCRERIDKLPRGCENGVAVARNSCGSIAYPATRTINGCRPFIGSIWVQGIKQWVTEESGSDVNSAIWSNRRHVITLTNIGSADAPHKLTAGTQVHKPTVTTVGKIDINVAVRSQGRRCQLATRPLPRIPSPL